MYILRILAVVALSAIPLIPIIWDLEKLRWLKKMLPVSIFCVLWIILASVNGVLSYTDHQDSERLELKLDKAEGNLIKLGSENKELNIKNNELSIEIREKTKENSAILGSFGERLSLQLSQDCLSDQKALVDAIKDKHKDTFSSSDEDAEAWANKFLKIIKQSKIERNQEHQRMLEISNKSLPYLTSLFDHAIDLFQKNANLLKNKGIVKRIEKNPIDTLENLRASSKEEIVINKVIFANGNIITLVVYSRLVTDGILRYHPKMKLISEKGTKSDIVFSLEGPRVRYSYSSGTFVPFAKSFPKMTYKIGVDYLEDEIFKSALKKNIQTGFEVSFESL